MTELFNAAEYLTERRVTAGDADRVAVRHPGGTLTYSELAAEVRRVAAGLSAIGVRPEERVLLCMVDDVELFTGILATMYIGAVAVPSSTMLTGAEMGKLVADSRARVLLGSHQFSDAVHTAAAGAPDLRHVVLTGPDGPDPAALGAGVTALTWEQLLEAGTASPVSAPYPTWDESPALWLYTSGTTGTPKGAMHRHADIRYVAETYGRQVLRVRPDDVCLSVAKLFFAYGIGNSMFFPLSVGASVVLEPSRPSPGLYAARVAEHGVTLFFAVPSFWGPLLAADSSVVDPAAFRTVRQGVSAGETLPARMFHGIRDRYGIEILDGIGSTEALHIFISNRPGAVTPGSSGTPVPGYQVELRRTDGTVIEEAGESGMLFISGDSICTGYWCRTDVNRAVFHGEWMRTGDQYVRNDDGTYTCLGRADDVLKVGGIWVSPTEVESRLLEHPAVAEAVVIGVPDADGLDKPVAYVVPRPGAVVDPDEVIAFCRAGLAAFKRPRAVLPIAELPKTATGKIQRFRLRALAATAPVSEAVSQQETPV
ncbi:benzoate-CoA ligase family protein [Pseudonocardia bannensis]|uniref:Benzoate-CoA ligase family protein n=1 Tax=Pseudonocardia bannensis TaxID=630973 RepID=A0A848DJE6_9PSEU|nr:benzoate-CoA ligase family protein [Pseudonocardia bannensis]NMH92827.1 benzoate-CoA ligase family protein [Pseudonocardia bannensis]